MSDDKPKIGIDRPHSIFRAADDIKYRGYQTKCFDAGIEPLGPEEWAKAGKPKMPPSESK